MSVDVTRIPGQCKCGKHWYSFTERRWYLRTDAGSVPLESVPRCATPVAGGMVIPPGTPVATCRSCGAAIYFVKTAAGRTCPANADGTSHFTTCDDPNRFSKKARRR